MHEPALEINSERCTRCGRCVQVCPQRILVGGEAAPPYLPVEQASLCMDCGHCAAVCPAAALQRPGTRLGPGVSGSGSSSPEEILTLMDARRSVRLYEERPLTAAVVEEVMQAARSAPTAHHAREVGAVAMIETAAIIRAREGVFRFYRRLFKVVRNPVLRIALSTVYGRARVADLVAMLPQLDQIQQWVDAGADPLFHHAPALLVLHGPSTAETVETDCALAAAQITLLAPALGLGTCYIGYAAAAIKRSAPLADLCGIPAGHKAQVVLTIGYPAVPFARPIVRPPIPLRFA